MDVDCRRDLVDAISNDLGGSRRRCWGSVCVLSSIMRDPSDEYIESGRYDAKEGGGARAMYLVVFSACVCRSCHEVSIGIPLVASCSGDH
jgi:hypothetical protein